MLFEYTLLKFNYGKKKSEGIKDSGYSMNLK